MDSPWRAKVDDAIGACCVQDPMRNRAPVVSMVASALVGGPNVASSRVDNQDERLWDPVLAVEVPKESA